MANQYYRIVHSVPVDDLKRICPTINLDQCQFLQMPDDAQYANQPVFITHDQQQIVINNDQVQQIIYQQPQQQQQQQPGQLVSNQQQPPKQYIIQEEDIQTDSTNFVTQSGQVLDLFKWEMGKLYYNGGVRTLSDFDRSVSGCDAKTLNS